METLLAARFNEYISNTKPSVKRHTREWSELFLIWLDGYLGAIRDISEDGDRPSMAGQASHEKLITGLEASDLSHLAIVPRP